ncbi:MAG TPA: Na+/H+ antiporter NhaC [Candidatus Blautia pullicola]|jgi:NhaC family Na+:H+ antiporter|uniref:Na+/H+ antiporter NhaC n=1 Tax=Candidatus Blautia pullicola TaxID=2838498 RepID=A0A9D2JRY4_9FIRM|nr:Na+/H+ antiporter NhaC [Candidatus Blautia pullicola]
MEEKRNKRQKRKPTTLQALFPIVFMFVILGVGYGYLGLATEVLIVVACIVAGCMASYLGYTWQELIDAAVKKVSDTLSATFILWSVGFLIGGLMFCGAIPMIINYGVQIVNPRFMLVTAFLSSALLSIVTGTSWGAAGTIGVAMMGIAGGLGVSLPATAGAVVSGSFFGDKLSPLSDTTNLAPMAAGSNLYEHIKHMLYTTVPASLVALVVYLIVGLKTSGTLVTPENVELMISQLHEMFHFNPIILIPFVLVIAGSLLKWPTIPTMLGAGLLGIILGITVQGFSLVDGCTALISGFDVSMTGFTGEASPDILNLLNRGGVNSVISTTVLVFVAMAFAGIVSVSGMLDKVLELLLKHVHSVTGLVGSTILACFTVALTTGSSYLSILVPGQLFKDAYAQRGLAAKNLSRTLEDSGTVVVPLVPWSAAGAYMAVTLGVPTLSYLPWAIMNYTGIIFAIILAFTGIGIAKIKTDEK